MEFTALDVLALNDAPTGAAGASAALTGTAVGGLLEAEVVTGGDTIIITLTNDTWVAAGGTFDAQRQAIIDGLDSAQSESNGWNIRIRDAMAVSAVVRTSAAVVTITLPAAALYSVTANETVTVTVPGAALTAGNPLTASPTITVTAAVGGVLLNATFGTDLDGFDAGTRVAAEGADFATGYLSVAAGVTATRSFTAIGSGIFRCDFWIQIADVETAADTTKNTFLYLLPTAGAVSSANSITAFSFSRNTTQSASATLFHLSYRDGTAFQDFPQLTLFRRAAAWVKFSVVADFTAKTFTIYLNDVEWQRGITWANNVAADFSRVVILQSASAPAALFDSIRVEAAWVTPTESVLVNHDFTAGATGEIETLTPTTDTRAVNAQPWKVADDTATYGAFTVANTTGATPDAAKVCSAAVRCLAQGIVEVEFQSSVAGDIYFGLQFRSWEQASNGGAGLFRIFGAATNTIILQLPNAVSVPTIVQTAAFTPAANTTYTLKVEMRGRYIICSRKASAMDSGSYTEIFTHQITSSATGGRGMLSEEYAGPLIATTLGATDNRAKRFRFTGAIPSDEKNITVGGASYNVCYGSVRSLSHASANLPTRNLFLSKGIQYGHRSRADMGNYATAQQTIYDGTHVKSYRQRSLNLTEYQYLGRSEAYVTALRRGLHISDRTVPLEATENLAPDFDLRPELWVGSYRTAASTGAGAALNDLAYHDWRADRDNQSLPLCVQRCTVFGSANQVRLTSVIFNISNWTAVGTSIDLTHKLLGSGEPISQAVGMSTADVVDGTDYICGRAYLIESAAGLALSDSVLTDFRDDIKTPATLTFTTGSLKTDASGDTNTDGWNERHGWYEITCASGLANWTLPVSSGTRYMAAFRLNGASLGTYTVTIAGSAGVLGTDYVIDDLGGSVQILQLLTNRTANTTIALTGPATVPGAPTIGTAVAGIESAEVSFTAPASNGGSPITSYRAISTPGSITGTLSQAGSGTITVNGLTGGQSYTFTVRATNDAGNSAESGASNSVTPTSAPASTAGVATIAGSVLAVSTAVPATFDAAGYAALTYTNIGEITDLGRGYGRAYSTTTRAPIDSPQVTQRKSHYEQPAIDMTMAWDQSNAGQDLLRTAADNDSTLTFKLTVQGGDIRYFTAEVSRLVEDHGSVNDLRQGSVTLLMQRDIVAYPA